MLKAMLFRHSRTDRETVGFMLLAGHIFYTMEPTWANNTVNKSCIPAGVYTAKYLKSSGSGKYRPCFHVMSVSHRTAILIHSGNTWQETKGCILPGMALGTLAGSTAVLYSRKAVNKIAEITNKQWFTLEVFDGLVS